MSSHTQIKAKCLNCSLHFIICTWYPEEFTANKIRCPECGVRGAESKCDFKYPGDSLLAAKLHYEETGHKSVFEESKKSLWTWLFGKP